MSSSTLFSPLPIANGKLTLSHRVIMAPMTRNRGVPLTSDNDESDQHDHHIRSRTWIPDDTVALYYAQRATPGGLLITEGIPPSLEASGMPGVPGLFDTAHHVASWSRVTRAVHDRNGFIYAQLWHAGRATVPQMTGCPVVSASATAWEEAEETFPFRTADTKEKIRYRDFPPLAMTEEHIAQTIGDFVRAARMAMEAGFDGVEINGGNGNLLDQFLHSNINTRTDSYGGSPEARCKFPLKLIAAVAAEVGATNVGVRLEPTGLYNGTYGDERVETWSYLCEQIAATYAEDNTGGGATGRLSYAHFIEPRMDRVEQVGERFWKGWSLPEVSNAPFRDILQKAKIPCITCGGWNASTAESAVDKSSGEGWDAVAFAKWFVSNPDLPERIRLGKPLQAYDRSRFYGSWDGIRENGYVDYLDWRAAEEKAILEEVSKRDVVVETKVKEVKA